MGNLGLIILNYNSADDTSICVDRLLSFERDYHIVIVDNCSTDESYDTLREQYGDWERVDVIKTDRNGGYGYGNNFGMRYAIDHYAVEIVGVINPDVLIPEADVIDTMVSTLYADQAYGIVGGVIIGPDGNRLLNRSGWNIQTSAQIIRDHFLIYDRFKKAPAMPELAPDIVQTDCVAGCFFLARVSCMQDIGFFDEEMFMYQEESVVGIKCREHGYKEVIALDAHYFHNHHVRDNADMTFRDKILATKEDYDSLSYICRKYYTSALVPLLAIVEFFNRIYLAGCYVKYRLFG